jgi:hypothetical protein
MASKSVSQRVFDPPKVTSPNRNAMSAAGFLKKRKEKERSNLDKRLGP